MIGGARAGGVPMDGGAKPIWCSLNVSLAVACARKPDHRKAAPEKKIAVTPLLTFEGADIVDLDADRPIEEVLAAEKAIRNLWRRRAGRYSADGGINGCALRRAAIRQGGDAIFRHRRRGREGKALFFSAPQRRDDGVPTLHRCAALTLQRNEGNARRRGGWQHQIHIHAVGDQLTPETQPFFPSRSSPAPPG